MTHRLTSHRRLLAGALLSLASFLAIVALAHDDGRSAVFSNRSMTPAQLQTLSKHMRQPIYWAPSSERLTVSRTSGDAVLVADQTGAVVATYPMRDAEQNLRRQASRDGRHVLAAASDGSVMLLDRDRPENVYLARPGSDRQVEVHAPGNRAVRLASTGRVVPVAVIR